MDAAPQGCAVVDRDAVARRDVSRDTFGRTIDYLRIAITDRCNYRCVYCMPAEGVRFKPHEQILTFEQIERFVRVAAGYGIRHLRLTGGEPLVRRGVAELAGMLSAIPGIEDISITTNGALLPRYARDLVANGVSKVNISLDTLDAEKYRRLTRGGELQKALDGIRAAEAAGFAPIKLNAVLLGGVNDDEIPALCALTMDRPIEMRFIELMPIGDALYFGKEACIPVDTVLEKMPQLTPLPRGRSSVARRYTLPGAKGSIGLISPVSCSFCSECNRIRLTADGCMKPCLHSAEEFPLRGKHGDALRRAICDAVNAKPEAHIDFTGTQRSESARNMNQIGG